MTTLSSSIGVESPRIKLPLSECIPLCVPARSSSLCFPSCLSVGQECQTAESVPASGCARTLLAAPFVSGASSPTQHRLHITSVQPSLPQDLMAGLCMSQAKRTTQGPPAPAPATTRPQPPALGNTPLLRPALLLPVHAPPQILHPPTPTNMWSASASTPRPVRPAAPLVHPSAPRPQRSSKPSSQQVAL